MARMHNMGSMYPLLSCRTKWTVTGFITSSFMSTVFPAHESHCLLLFAWLLVIVTFFSSFADDDVETWGREYEVVTGLA